MTITQSNYELYALEYLEGTLSPTLQQAMELFLETNPIIKEELEAMRELVIVEPDETILFTKKSKLLKKERQRLVLWKRPWQLGIAASISLLVGFMAIYQVQHIDNWNKEAIVHVPSIEIEDKQSEDIITKIAVEEVTLQAPNSQVASNSNQALINPKANVKQTTGETLKKRTKTNVLKNRITLDNKTLAKTTVSLQNIANKPQGLSLATLGMKRQELTPSIETDNSVSTITRLKEETVTNSTQPITQSVRAKGVAALPLLSLQVLPTKKLRSDPSLEHIINQSFQDGLLAYHNNPKKRTLKSLVGKLPGSSGVGVSLLPSFFTD